MEPRARQLLLYIAGSKRSKVVDILSSCYSSPQLLREPGLSLMNKKPLRVIDLYSLITCTCSLAMTVASSAAHGPKWQRMTWWAQFNQGHKCLWISTPLEWCRGYCDTTNAHGKPQTLVQALPRLFTFTSVLLKLIEHFYFIDRGAENYKGGSIGHMLLTLDVTHARALSNSVRVRMKLSHLITFTACVAAQV